MNQQPNPEPPTTRRPYHHGDLRATLVRTALECLEAGEPYSLRAVAKHVGVSPTAPYKHFADRRALDTAVAIEGFKAISADLAAVLDDVPAEASPLETLTELGVAYVEFALRRPALFRLMFGNETEDSHSDRVRAAQDMHNLLGVALERLFPGAVPPGLAMGLWSLAHGAAFLHLDGKYPPYPAEEVAERVRLGATAVLCLQLEA